MLLRRIPVSKINPAPYNPRRDLQPGDPEYEKIARSVKEFGCVEPLVWNKRTGTLVGGHQRLKVLVARGDKQVDVSVVDLPLEREKALNVALNKVAGEWDQERLAKLLDELTRLPDFDFSLTGFEAPERDELLARVLAAGENRREENFDVDASLQAAGKGPSITQPGQLILLGKDPRTQHRLLCGDCTDPLQVRQLMKGERTAKAAGEAIAATRRAALFVTDPPYLVGYDGTNHPGTPKKSDPESPKKAKGSKFPSKNNKDWSSTYGVTWDDADGDPELYRKFCRAAIDEAIRPDAAWYCWHASRRQAMLESVWVEMGAFVHCQVIWAKNRPVLTRTWYAWQHEPCLFGWLKGKKPPRFRTKGEPMRSTVWPVDTIANGPDRPDHPTPKPLELFEIPMREHTRAGEVCYEPFAGSGTQIIAAQRLGRRCFAIEISPVYCDLIVRRFIAFAGEGAVAPEIAKRYRLVKGRRRVKRSRESKSQMDGGPAELSSPGEVSPAPAAAEPAQSVLTILRDIQAGTLPPCSLAIEDRQRCVEHLTAEGYATPEIAEILKVAERTILRDRKAIRAANALHIDEHFVAETVGGMIRHAEQTIARFRRIVRDRDTPAAVKVEAERSGWEVTRDLVQILQRLGHLPVATQQFRGELTHRVAEGLSFEQSTAELARLESILIGTNSPTAFIDGVNQTKSITARLALAEGDGGSTPPHQNKPHDHM